VLSPKGKVVDLAAGATPLDFAYVIHTDIGHRCRGAKVDGRIVPLSYVLKSGEQVEILTTRSGTPSRDWLNTNLGYLKTPRARSKVKTWFKHLDQEKNVSDGRSIIDRELSRVGMDKIKLQVLADTLKFNKTDELLVAVGRGEISAAQVVNAAQSILVPEHHDTEVLRRTVYRHEPEHIGDIKIQGVGNLLTTIARCCKPVPDDPIVGYITRGRGVTIHRQDCPNILRVQEDDLDRMIEVSWNSKQSSATYPVDIRVIAYDRPGLLKDIAFILSNENLNVLAINTKTDIKDHMAKMEITIEIVSIEQLSLVLAKINQLPNVVEVERRH